MNALTFAPMTAQQCAALIKSGEASALEITEAALARVSAGDSNINSYTALTEQRARREARAVDIARARGDALPPLAGVPYAVKNLFNIKYLATVAGAKIRLGDAPASADAALVRRLSTAGAVLTGALNMDAYAYGFTTENTHFGVTRNPRDVARVAGGSSGGSAAAVAAGFATFTLASDTNGSIRVPSSFCGVFGLKPTFGRLSRAGTYPFVPSLDHLGPLARSAYDLALIYDVLQGADADDPACAGRAIEPVLPMLNQGTAGLRVAVLGDYFHQWADDDARVAVEQAAVALGASEMVSLPESDRARAAAFVITAAEAGALYLDELRARMDDFEPLSRDRLIAGALLPAAWYLKAQRFRRWYQHEARKLFERFDLLIAPATPCVATAIGAERMLLNGVELPVRPNLGLLTQPISFIGLPVAVAPLWCASGAPNLPKSSKMPNLPMGVQLIAPPWREDICLRAAWTLEQSGLASSPVTAACAAIHSNA
jgi:1-carboxybiuret hydrolase